MNYNSKCNKNNKTKENWGKFAATIISAPERVRNTIKDKIERVYRSGKSYEFEKTHKLIEFEENESTTKKKSNFNTRSSIKMQTLKKFKIRPKSVNQNLKK